MKSIIETKYEDAIEWIALNDQPEDINLDSIKKYQTTLLIADVFDKAEGKVAKDIKDFRDEQVL